MEIIEALLNKINDCQSLLELIKDLNNDMNDSLNNLSDYTQLSQSFKILMKLDLFLKVRARIVDRVLPMWFALKELKPGLPIEVNTLIMTTIIQLMSEINPPKIDMDYCMFRCNSALKNVKEPRSLTDFVSRIIQKTKEDADWDLLHAWKLTLFKFANCSEDKEKVEDNGAVCRF